MSAMRRCGQAFGWDTLPRPHARSERRLGPHLPGSAHARSVRMPPVEGHLVRPIQVAVLAPPGTRAKLAANLAALRLLRDLNEDGRAPSPDDQRVLARWSGWGALAQVFDDADDRYAPERDELRRLLDDTEWQAARRTTLNAHYTGAGVVSAMWDAVAALGFDGGTVLEPGCGSGNFIGFAPDSASVTGVELDPTTARIASNLYGDRATIHAQPFEAYESHHDFDLVIGNVPFADVVPPTIPAATAPATEPAQVAYPNVVNSTHRANWTGSSVRRLASGTRGQVVKSGIS